MKNIIIAAMLASTALVGVAQAKDHKTFEPTTKPAVEEVVKKNSAHCRVLDMGPGINPTELSDYAKCWLDTHKADEQSGRFGGLFWIRVGDGFVSMRTQELANTG